MKIVITDLTRFKKPSEVCTAGVAEDGTVVRPMPYLSSDRCKELDIHPGGILEGEFKFTNGRAPHTEDAQFENLTFYGPCTGLEFKAALRSTLYNSLASGFEYDVQDGDKCIPVQSPPPRSLITIKVDPEQLEILEDGYNPDKLKATFSDGSGTELRYVSITDRGFFDFARKRAHAAGGIEEINEFIHSQSELYLRIGLGRVYSTAGRTGYWIQLNGIYTFPNYLEYIRCYD
ncbi:MAG: hypothetical protein WDZ51_11460 [Pirellulaceae bacterium]